MSAARDVVLIIDLGLTNCKASLLDLDAALVAYRSVRYPTRTPQVGRSEQDPVEWIRALHAAVTGLAIDTLQPAVRVGAIAVTGHMHAVVPVDAEGRTLGSCWTLFDQRAGEEAKMINRAVDAYAITGARLEPYTPAAKMLWMKRNVPDLFAQICCFLAPKDYLRAYLGGGLCTDPIDAAGMLLVDLESGAWSSELLREVGAPPVPEIRPASARDGALSPEVAGRLGIPAGVPIYVGAGDDIEALGAGLCEAGDTLEHLGTTGTLITCTERPLLDPQRMLETYPHAIEGRYLVGSATNAAGLSLDWARRWLERTGGDSRGALSLALDGLRADPPYYLPWIRGERGLIWRPDATGIYAGLRETHGAEAIAFGTYEGVAFSIHQILEAILVLGRAHDLSVERVTSGTSLADKAWATLRASIYGRPLQSLANGDLTALGCAIVALVGMGRFADAASGVKHVLRPVEEVAPDPALQEKLLMRYAKWSTLAANAQALEFIIDS